MVDISGYVAPGFEPVRDAFANNFEEHGEVGAQLSIRRGDDILVDIWGGERRDPDTDDVAPYDENTLQSVFSTTKGATAACVHILADRGELDLAAPVANVWPEFAANGKDAITTEMLMSHRAGLIDVEGEHTLEAALDWETVTSLLADATPVWNPDEQHGYHALTYGWLLGEIVRRVSGKRIGAFCADEIAHPLNAEFWIGLPEEHHDRVAPLLPFLPMAGLEGATLADGRPATEGGLVEAIEALFGEGAPLARALTAPGGAFSDQLVWNRAVVRSAEIPAANGVTNAPSLAKIYASLLGEVDGVRLISQETLDRALTEHSSGPDTVLMFPSRFGLGWMLDSVFSPFGSPTGFGHYGAGGSVGWADPQTGISGGYVMNQMLLGIAGDPRTMAILDSLGACLKR